jgi:hypothetical protein
MAQFKSAFFAFPSEPAELSNPIATAVELVKSNPSLSIQAWPHLQIFGAAIPDEVRGGIARANVFVCDITKPNQNVYYETGYSIGLGKSLAPVLNASFANATADIQRDGLFDIIGRPTRIRTASRKFSTTFRQQCLSTYTASRSIPISRSSS